MNYIHEKAVPVPLKKISSFENCKELSLNQSFIDPTKMSPPNTFMDKLAKRMDTYYSPKKTIENLSFKPNYHMEQLLSKYFFE